MITGLTFGGQSLLSSQIFLTAFKNGSFPSTVYTRSKRGGYNGSKVVTPSFASYQFVLDFTIIGLTFADLAIQRDAFFGVLGTVHSSGAQTLISTRSDGTMRQIDIKAISVTGDITSDDGLSSQVEVTFEAEFPFLQGSSPKSVDVLIFNGGGMSVPMGVPLDLSHNHSTTITIQNTGNYAAYPIFNFIGALHNPTITNNTTGKSLGISQVFTGSQSAVIDTYLRTVILQPSGNIGRQYVTGDFWTVPIGISTVTLGNDNTTDGGKCVISFRDTFLNI